MQKTRDGSNLRGAGCRQLAGLGEHLPSAVRFQPGFLLTAEIDAQGSQKLCRAVVQLPRDSPPLVILGAQQVSGKLMKPPIGPLKRFLGALEVGDVEHRSDDPSHLPRAVAGDY